MYKKIMFLMVAVALLAGAAMPAFAEDATVTPVKPVLGAIDVPCVQNVIEKRDTAISSAVGVYGSGVQTALSMRKEALKSAWAKTDRKARRTAINSAWKVYGKSLRDSRQAFNISRKSAWTAFGTDAKVCKVPKNETESPNVDAQI